MKETKLKNGLEIFEMIKNIDPNDLDSCRETINYIDQIHSHLKNYQMVFDMVVSKNVNVTS